MATQEPITILPSGDCALLVAFANEIDRRVSAQVIDLAGRITSAKLPGITELVPTFRSLMVHYNPSETGHSDLKAQIEPLLENLSTEPRTGHTWELPACYDPSLAPDLADVAEATGLSADEVVQRHAEAEYYVYMIGFLPGLPYMGDLAEALTLPRRTNPRTIVPKGSVAIAERMTTIYPVESPGGWHLIGRTPYDLYDPSRAQPTLFAAGDLVRFAPVSLKDYGELLTAAETGTLPLPRQLETGVTQ